MVKFLLDQTHLYNNNCIPSPLYLSATPSTILLQVIAAWQGDFAGSSRLPNLNSKVLMSPMYFDKPKVVDPLYKVRKEMVLMYTHLCAYVVYNNILNRVACHTSFVYLLKRANQLKTAVQGSLVCRLAPPCFFVHVDNMHVCSTSTECSVACLTHSTLT